MKNLVLRKLTRLEKVFSFISLFGMTFSIYGLLVGGTKLTHIASVWLVEFK